MLQALDKTGTLHISANIKTALTHCHVKGCNAGADTAHPFLALFMKVLGGTQTVTAPKYLHDLKDDAGNGVLEYMVAEYTVMSPTAFKTTDALVKEFRNRNFTQGVEKNGTPEPVPDKWKNWISTSLKLDPALSDEKPFDITTKVVPAAGGLKLINRNNGKATSRFEGGFPVHKDMTGITVPPDTAGRMAFLKDAMKTDPREKDGHPFPLHVRFGFSTIDEWMTGFDWVPTFDGRVLTFTGGHFVYTVRLPIVKVGTNQLIYNYYPKGGNATMNFREDNDKFKLFGSA
jgi:hypothetical protein